eukprot:366445-Chlamydomonas_euryale.AAC.16
MFSADFLFLASLLATFRGPVQVVSMRPLRQVVCLTSVEAAPCFKNDGEPRNARACQDTGAERAPARGRNRRKLDSPLRLCAKRTRHSTPQSYCSMGQYTPWHMGPALHVHRHLTLRTAALETRPGNPPPTHDGRGTSTTSHRGPGACRDASPPPPIIRHEASRPRCQTGTAERPSWRAAAEWWGGTHPATSVSAWTARPPAATALLRALPSLGAASDPAAERGRAAQARGRAPRAWGQAPRRPRWRTQTAPWWPRTRAQPSRASASAPGMTCASSKASLRRARITPAALRSWDYGRWRGNRGGAHRGRAAAASNPDYLGAGVGELFSAD